MSSLDPMYMGIGIHFQKKLRDFSGSRKSMQDWGSLINTKLEELCEFYHATSLQLVPNVINI